MTKKRIYEGTITLGTNTIPCYVIDGKRFVSQAEVFKAFGRMQRGNSRNEVNGIKLPTFMDANNLIPFINSELLTLIKPVNEKNQQGVTLNLFNAEIIPAVAELYLKARDADALKESQTIVAKSAEILIRALAKVGIIALVDEATGYQYDREKLELQTILKLFISEDILEWQRTFHLGFYKEIFRLWNIPFTKEWLRRKPSFIGHLTNTFVYKNLPKGSFLLKKLKEKTPKNEDGDLLVRLHQSLTPFGKEELRKVIYTVESFAAISATQDQFKKLMQNRYGQTSLDLNFDVNEPVKPTKTIDKPTNFDMALKGLLSVPHEQKNEK